MPLVIEFDPCDKETLYEPILSHAAVMCQIHDKLVEGELWAEVTGVTIWGHIKILPGLCHVTRDHFYLGVIFHSVAFLHSK